MEKTKREAIKELTKIQGKGKSRFDAFTLRHAISLCQSYFPEGQFRQGNQIQDDLLDCLEECERDRR